MYTYICTYAKGLGAEPRSVGAGTVGVGKVFFFFFITLEPSVE